MCANAKLESHSTFLSIAVAHCSDSWVNIVAALKLDALQVIQSHLDEIKADIRSITSVSPVSHIPCHS